METQTFKLKPKPTSSRLCPSLAFRTWKRLCVFILTALGFVMTNQWTPDGDGKVRWCWLQLGAAALMLQEFKKDHHPNSGRPDGKLGVGVAISFQCKDALAIYKEVRSRGIEAKRPFVGNGMWVTSVHDPDGYKLEFESRTDVPEETVFSEDEGAQSS